MYIGLHVKYRYSVQTLMTLEFCRLREIKQISSFIKIRPVGEKLFCAYRHTDSMKLIVAFRSFASAPNNI